MGRGMSPLTLRILEVTKEEWMPEEDVIQEAMYTLSPGETLRWYKSKKGIQESKRREKWTTEQWIRAAQRAKTLAMLNNLVSNGRIAREKRGDKKFVKLENPIKSVYVVVDSDNIHVSEATDVVVETFNLNYFPKTVEETAKTIESLTLMLRANRFHGQVQNKTRLYLNRLQVHKTLLQEKEESNVTI